MASRPALVFALYWCIGPNIPAHLTHEMIWVEREREVVALVNEHDSTKQILQARVYWLEREGYIDVVV